MVRRPVPPRVTVSRHTKPESEMREIENARDPINAATFEDANARECVIVPPKFTEKNLHSKRPPQKEKIEVPSSK